MLLQAPHLAVGHPLRMHDDESQAVTQKLLCTLVSAVGSVADAMSRFGLKFFLGTNDSLFY